MTQEQKSQLYTNLLSQHTHLDNKINEIKAEDFEINDEQMGRIRVLQHTRLDNQINEIKAEHFEMNDEQMGRIRVLQSKQGQLVGQMQQLMQG